MSKLKIAVIPGDGIGWEVIPEGLKFLKPLAGNITSIIHLQSSIGDARGTIKREN